jgi:DNA-directed RNA polymerase subunit F
MAILRNSHNTSLRKAIVLVSQAKRCREHELYYQQRRATTFLQAKLGY